MMSSKSELWQAERQTLDLLAILARVDHRRAVIRRQAWQRPGESWGAVYDETTAMRAEIAELRAQMSECWQRLSTMARGEM